MAAGFNLFGPLLDEAAKGGNARARADHYQRGVGCVEGEVEGLVAWLYVDVDVVAWLEGGEVVGCYAEESFAAFLVGFFVQDAPG